MKLYEYLSRRKKERNDVTQYAFILTLHYPWLGTFLLCLIFPLTTVCWFPLVLSNNYNHCKVGWSTLWLLTACPTILSSLCAYILFPPDLFPEEQLSKSLSEAEVFHLHAMQLKDCIAKTFRSSVVMEKYSRLTKEILNCTSTTSDRISKMVDFALPFQHQNKQGYKSSLTGPPWTTQDYCLCSYNMSLRSPAFAML